MLFEAKTATQLYFPTWLQWCHLSFPTVYLGGPSAVSISSTNCTSIWARLKFRPFQQHAFRMRHFWAGDWTNAREEWREDWCEVINWRQCPSSAARLRFATMQRFFAPPAFSSSVGYLRCRFHFSKRMPFMYFENYETTIFYCMNEILSISIQKC